MTPLTQYKKEGKMMTLLQRVGDVAIFWDELHDYEVIHIHKQKAGKREVPDSKNPGQKKTLVFEDKELPPSTNEWGWLGFSHSTLEAATATLEREVGKIEIAKQNP